MGPWRRAAGGGGNPRASRATCSARGYPGRALSPAAPLPSGHPPSPASDPHTPGRTPTSTPPPPPPPLPPPLRKANTQEGQRRPLISLLPFLPGGCLTGVLALPAPRLAPAQRLPGSAAAGQRGRDAGSARPPACPAGAAGLPPLLPTWCGRRLRSLLGRCGARSPEPRFFLFLSPPPPAPGKFLIYFFKPSIRKSCGEEPSPALPYIFIGRSVPSSVCHTGRQRATLLINGWEGASSIFELSAGDLRCGGWAQLGCPWGEGGSPRGAAAGPGRLRAALARRPWHGGHGSAGRPSCCVWCCPPAPPPAASAAGAQGLPSSCEPAGTRRSAPPGPAARPRSYPSLPFVPALRAGPSARLLRADPSGSRRLTVQGRARCSLSYSPRAIVLSARAGAYGFILQKVRLYIIKMSPPYIASPSSSPKMSLNGFINVFIFHHFFFPNTNAFTVSLVIKTGVLN